MLARRAFASCAICGVLGLTATRVAAQPAGGLTRTLVRQEAVPGTNYVTMQMLIEIAPNFTVGRHTHPGHEATYVVEGSVELQVQGQPNRMVGPGDSFLVPAAVPHAARTGAAKVKLFATYVVDKDKPLATPAPE